MPLVETRGGAGKGSCVVKAGGRSPQRCGKRVGFTLQLSEIAMLQGFRHTGQNLRCISRLRAGSKDGVLVPRTPAKPLRRKQRLFDIDKIAVDRGSIRRVRRQGRERIIRAGGCFRKSRDRIRQWF